MVLSDSPDKMTSFLLPERIYEAFNSEMHPEAEKKRDILISGYLFYFDKDKWLPASYLFFS